MVVVDIVVVEVVIVVVVVVEVVVGSRNCGISSSSESTENSTSFIECSIYIFEFSMTTIEFLIK